MADNLLALQVQPAPSIGPAINGLLQARQTQAETAQTNALQQAFASGDPSAIARAGSPQGAMQMLGFQDASRANEGWLRFGEAAARGDEAAFTSLSAVAPEKAKIVSDIRQNQAAILSSMSTTQREDAKTYFPMLGSQLLAASSESDPARLNASLSALKPIAVRVGMKPEEVDAFIKQASGPNGRETLSAMGLALLATGTAAQNELTKGAFGPTEFKPNTLVPPAARPGMGLGGTPPDTIGALPVTPTAGGALAIGSTDAGGPFEGSGMDPQIANILLKGDRASKLYAFAYNEYTQPKMQVTTAEDGITQIMVPVPPKVDPRILPPILPGSEGQGAAAPAGATTGAPVETAAAGGPPGASASAAPASGLPPGAIVLGTKPPTEQMVRARGFASIVDKESATVDKTFAALSDPAQQALAFGGDLTRWAQSDDYQRGANAIKSIIAAYLYTASGQAIPDSEAARQAGLLMPQLGEHGPALDDKKERIAFYINSIKTMANYPAGQSPAAPAATGPQIGAVEDGYRFLGGDPKLPKNWTKAP